MKSAVFGILAVVLVLGITGTLADDLYDDDYYQYGRIPYGKSYGGKYMSHTAFRYPQPVPFPVPAPGFGESGNDGLFGGQGFGIFFILLLVLLLNNNNTIG